MKIKVVARQTALRINDELFQELRLATVATVGSNSRLTANREDVVQSMS